MPGVLTSLGRSARFVQNPGLTAFRQVAHHPAKIIKVLSGFLAGVAVETFFVRWHESPNCARRSTAGRTDSYPTCRAEKKAA